MRSKKEVPKRGRSGGRRIKKHPPDRGTRVTKEAESRGDQGGVIRRNADAAVSLTDLDPEKELLALGNGERDSDRSRRGRGGRGIAFNEASETVRTLEVVDGWVLRAGGEDEEGPVIIRPVIGIGVTTSTELSSLAGTQTSHESVGGHGEARGSVVKDSEGSDHPGGVKSNVPVETKEVDREADPVNPRDVGGVGVPLRPLKVGKHIEPAVGENAHPITDSLLELGRRVDRDDAVPDVSPGPVAREHDTALLARDGSATESSARKEESHKRSNPEGRPISGEGPHKGPAKITLQLQQGSGGLSSSTQGHPVRSGGTREGPWCRGTG